MDSQFFKEIEHAKEEPLKIARWWEGGFEKIIIEGVTYDAQYFRTFAEPETDVLYQIRKDEDGVVCLTVINTPEKAAEFFKSIEQGDPAPMENEHGI
jgi:hypothetical protein